ncbi:MAG: hypothetical protein DMD33_18465 [Gemmatimonadetes bacterium]|nr:MAG: hypothetical protein DMD33_18465 [Gemmatimonadota bacterium]
MVTDSQPAPACWVLLYTGGSIGRRFPPKDLVDLFATVDTSDQPTGWLCEGTIVLDLEATSGRYYYPWPDKTLAKGQDWNAYLDSLFAPHGRLQSLDSAVAMIAAKAGQPRGGFRVVLMIPYSRPGADTVWVGRTSFVLTDPEGRRRAVEAYIDEVAQRFAAARFQHLTFVGYYWLNEEIRSVDSVLVKQTADAVHRRRFQFFWIPYYTAPGGPSWRAYGFDHAWLQPNYFFHPEVPVVRLDTAVSRARAWNLGIELEFNPKMFDQWQFADRLEPYLTVLEGAPDLRARSVAIYEGVGALIRLARSRDPWHRALYSRLVAVLRQSGTGASDLK